MNLELGTYRVRTQKSDGGQNLTIFLEPTEDNSSKTQKQKPNALYTTGPIQLETSDQAIQHRFQEGGEWTLEIREAQARPVGSNR